MDGAVNTEGSEISAVLSKPQKEVVSSDNRNVSPEQYDVVSRGGLEYVANNGWKEYRDMLESMTWEPIVEREIKKIMTLRKQAESEVPQPKDVIAARAEIKKYAQDIRANFTRINTDQSYYALSEKDGASDLDKKLTLVGKKEPWIGQGKMTRIYIALAETGMRDGFETLRKELDANGALEKMRLVLNLEELGNDDLDRTPNNAIIMYISDSNPDVLTKAALAIESAQAKHSASFRLTSQQLADVNRSSAAEFMVPLGAASWFVEVEPNLEGRSYHASVFPDINRCIYRGKPTSVNGLPNIETYRETLNYRRPEIRHKAQITDSMGKLLPRRISMPGLVIQ